MATQISNVELDEVSLVDRPANPKARVLLVKRDTTAKQDVSLEPTAGTEADTVCPECGEDPCVCEPVEDEEEIEMGKENCKPPIPEEMTKVEGVQFVIGFPEKGGSQIQSVIFDSKIWDKAKAQKWLAAHDLTSEKIDETTDSLRFRQKDPSEFKRFRTITPGAQISKQLRGSQGWMALQSKITEAFRNK